MATADELLAGVIGDDNVIVVDLDSRVLHIPESIKNMGVESDDEVLRLSFRVERYYCGVDLSKFNVRINFLNAKDEGDAHQPNDVVASANYITFSWLVGRNAVLYKGNVTFNVCMREMGEDGVVLREFNTTPSILPVLEGLETGEQIVQEYVDILEQWERRFFTANTDGVTNINEAANAAVAKVQAEGAAQVTAVEAVAVRAENAATQVEAIVAGNEAYTKYESDTQYGVPIVSEASGEGLVIINDSAKMPLQGLKIFGKTTRVETTGKNLLPYPYYDTTRTVNGITFTDNGDGSITCNGTATATASFNLMNNLAVHPFEMGENYILSGCPSGGSNTSYAIGWHNIGSEYGNGRTIVITEDTVYTAYIVIHSGTTVSNLTFRPMVRLASITDATWEPYSGGVVGPNPDYPFEMKSIGVDGGINVLLRGKNLCPTGSVVSSNEAPSGAITLENIKAHGTYVFSTLVTRYSDDAVTNARISMIIRYTDGTQTYNSSAFDETNTEADGVQRRKTTKITSDSTKTIKSITIIPFDYSSKTSRHAKAEQIQLEFGSEATEYEPYKDGGSLTWALGGLPGIQLSDGSWVRDEVDFGRGVYIKRLKHVAITGTEDWRSDRVDQADKYRYWLWINDMKSPSASNVRGAVLTNYYPTRSADATYVRTEAVSIQGNEKKLHIYNKSYTTGDVDIWKEYLAGLYSSGKPLEIMYALATPIETELTADELAQYAALMSQRPNTVAMNDANTDMTVSYTADTKLYIDNKFAELMAKTGA